MRTKRSDDMFKWKEWDDGDRKYLDKEKHYLRYHQDVVEESSMVIPFEYYPAIKKLLRRSKLQVVKQKPILMVRVAPFIHHPVEVCDDITIEIGKTYEVQEWD